MTKAQRPRPWHEIVRLKDELRTGELALTYGGGKTHTLITLYHLFRDT